MIGSLGRHRKNVALCLLFSLAATTARAGHDDEYNWRCPYTPDGVCTPSRHTYGHYPTKWSRWPGVTDDDYESSVTGGAPAGRGSPTGTAPRETPNDILPPGDNSGTDAAPGPPGGDDAPPPLTPPGEARPDILTPPGEDIMDELLPDDPAPRPEAVPDAVPNAEAEPLPEPTPETTPEPQPESEKPFDDDPFKDDPLFNDDPPSPPSGTKRSEIEVEPGAASPTMPAMNRAPNRLPTAQRSRNVPQSRLSRSATPGEPRLMPAQSKGKSAARQSSRGGVSPPRNPLRSSPEPEMVAVDEMVEPTQWQEPAAESELETGWHANPLRR